MKRAATSGWFCAQLGAREHYAVPRALHRRGKLSLLCTDFWAGRGLRAAARLAPAKGLRSMAARFHPELMAGAKSMVCSWNLRALGWARRSHRTSHENDSQAVFLKFTEIGRAFATAVRQELKRRRDWSPEAIFFAYDTGALETLEWLQERGARGIVSQMDPNRAEVEMVREEERRWPGWALSPTEVPDAYFRRREEEWRLATRIVVNSEFCRRALAQQGVPDSKLTVIPLCYEPPPLPASGNRALLERKPLVEGRSPLRVLWLGQVILRKGIQYLLQAAQLLANEKIRFDIVGPAGISSEAMKGVAANVTFHGPVNRSEAHAWYRQADLFVFPTLSDGFGLTQLEALAHGLPVITTANCGDVVTDSVDGFIIPPRDAEALARTILRYRNEPDLGREHRAAALRKAGEFTLDRLANQLTQLEAEIRG